MNMGNLIRVCAVALVSLAGVGAYSQEKAGEASLNEAFRKIGFNPQAKGCGYFVILADPHYAAPGTNFKSSAMECMPKVIKEIKTWGVPPNFIITLGDIVSSGNPCFGASINNTENMMKEFDMFKSDMATLAPIPYKVVPGNHDCTGPLDFDYNDFKKAFPNQHPYEAFDYNGMRCIILNGGHNGMLDEKQEQWLVDEFKRLERNKNVIIFVHQPLGAVRSEWKLSKSVRSVVENYEGDVFVFCGHNHGNHTEVLKAPTGKRVRQVVVEAFRHTNSPVYWVCCVKNGEIIATIFRDKNGRFTDIDVSKSAARDWLLPWEGMDVIATFDNSSADFHETSRKGGNCVYFYFYLHNLEGWLDLSNLKENFSTLYLMGTTLYFEKDASKNATLQLSADGKKYETVNIVPADKKMVYKVVLPQSLRHAKKLYFKLDFKHIDGGFTGFAIGK